MNETRKENNAGATYAHGGAEEKLGVGRWVSDSAERAEATVRAHPYFTLGVLAGIGIATVGAVLLTTRRRRGFFDRLMDIF